LKIIGVEFRIQAHDPKLGPQQREIGIVPCDIVAHVDQPENGYWGGSVYLNMTIHTDMGDLTLQQMIPDNFVNEKFTQQTRIHAQQRFPRSETVMVEGQELERREK
jgi:hypothetical protein